MAVGMMVATAVYPLLQKIAPDTELIMKRGAGLVTSIPLVRKGTDGTQAPTRR
jgi:cyanate permease